MADPKEIPRNIAGVSADLLRNEYKRMFGHLKPRDPARIPRMLDLVGNRWLRSPDLRFFQLLEGIFGCPILLKKCFFYQEDDITETLLTKEHSSARSEHFSDKEEVEGSSPSVPTTIDICTSCEHGNKFGECVNEFDNECIFYKHLENHYEPVEEE